MNIGLAIDNVITDFDDMLLKEFLIADKMKRNSGIINPLAKHITSGMFDWSRDEIDDFFANNMERIAKKLKLRRNCKKYMDLLLKDGHKLFLITHRAYPDYKTPEKTTLEWLKNKKINYTRLILSAKPDKTEECKKFNIDLMVDDRVSQCKIMKDCGVNAIVMLTRYNKKQIGDLPYAKSWENLYSIISKCESKI